MTIRYRDVSHYDAQNGNYSLAEAGLILDNRYPYVMAKATEGTTYIDPMYLYYQEWCRRLPHVWCGAYHFLHEGNAIAQARYAHSHINPIVGVMLDAEWSKFGGTPGIEDIKEFIVEFRRLGGRCNLVYLPEWYWAGHLNSPDLSFFNDEKLSLVSSNYTDPNPSDTGPGWNPYGGITPTIWQYSGGPDMNLFKGTTQELESLTVTLH